MEDVFWLWKKSKTQRFSHLRHHLPPHQWVSLGTKWTRVGEDGSETLQCRGLRALPAWTWHTAHREAAPRAIYTLSSLFQHWLSLQSSYPTRNKNSLPLHSFPGCANLRVSIPPHRSCILIWWCRAEGLHLSPILKLFSYVLNWVFNPHRHQVSQDYFWVNYTATDNDDLQ